MQPPTRISANPPGLNLGLYALALSKARGELLDAAQIAKEWTRAPLVAAALEAQALCTTKGAVPAMTTESPLTSFQITAELPALLLGAGDAIDLALPRMRVVPPNFPVVREQDAGSASGWVADGLPFPAVKFAFDTVTLKLALLGAFMVLSEEIRRVQRAELLLRNVLVALGARADTRAFLDPTSAGGSGAPASITNGVSETAWTTAADTLDAMLAAISTPGTGLVWFISPKDLARLAALLGGSAPDLPRTLLGLPVLSVPYGPAGQITLADVSQVLFAGGDAFALDIATSATVEMATDPTNASATGSPPEPIATQVVSLYQSNSIGYRLSRAMQWEVARAGAVAWSTLPAGSPA